MIRGILRWINDIPEDMSRRDANDLYTLKVFGVFIVTAAIVFALLVAVTYIWDKWTKIPCKKKQHWNDNFVVVVDKMIAATIKFIQVAWVILTYIAHGVEWVLKNLMKVTIRFIHTLAIGLVWLTTRTTDAFSAIAWATMKWMKKHDGNHARKASSRYKRICGFRARR